MKIIKPVIGQRFFVISPDCEIIEIECSEIITNGTVTEYGFNEVYLSTNRIYIEESDLSQFCIFNTKESAEVWLSEVNEDND